MCPSTRGSRGKGNMWMFVYEKNNEIKTWSLMKSCKDILLKKNR